MGKGKGCAEVMVEEPASLFFWSLIVVLFVLVIGNFILTLSIISFFKIGFGMEAIEVIPEHKAIKFFGTTDFKTVYKKDGLIESFKDDPMVIECEFFMYEENRVKIILQKSELFPLLLYIPLKTSPFLAENGEIRFDLVDRKGHTHNRFNMNGEKVEITNVREFVVKDPDTKESIFSTASKLKWNFEKPMKKLETTSIHGAGFSSPIDQKLQVESLNMFIQGAEGTKIEGKSQLISAEKNVYLKSYNGSIILDAPSIYLLVERLPKVNMTYPSIDWKYKLCVCYPKGVLYRAPYPKHLSESQARKYDVCKNVEQRFCT